MTALATTYIITIRTVPNKRRVGRIFSSDLIIVPSRLLGTPSWLPPPAENEKCAGAEKSAGAQKSAGA